MTHAKIQSNAERCHFCWTSFQYENGSYLGKPVKKRFPRKFYKSCTRHLTNIFGDDDSLLDDFEGGVDGTLKSVVMCTICFKFAKKISELNGQLEKLEDEISKFVDSTVEYVLNLRDTRKKLDKIKERSISPTQGVENIITTNRSLGRPEEVIIHIKSENFPGFDFEPEDVTDFFSVDGYGENSNFDFVEIIEEPEAYDGSDGTLQNPLEVVMTEGNATDTLRVDDEAVASVPCSTSETLTMQTENVAMDHENTVQTNPKQEKSNTSCKLSDDHSNPATETDSGIDTPRTPCEPSITSPNPQQWFNCVLCKKEDQKRFPTLESLHLHIDIYHKVPPPESLISNNRVSTQPFGMEPMFRPPTINPNYPKCKSCGKMYSSPQDEYNHEKICHLRPTLQQPPTTQGFPPQNYPVLQSHMPQQTPINQSHMPQQMYSNQNHLPHQSSSNHSHNDMFCKLCPSGQTQPPFHVTTAPCNTPNCNLCPPTHSNQSTIPIDKKFNITNSCPYCPATFAQPDQLNFHIRTHSEMRNPNIRPGGMPPQMVGRYAENTVVTNRPVYNPQWANYNNNNSNPTDGYNRQFRCTICPQVFNQMSELYNHSFLHQPSNAPRNSSSNPNLPYTNSNPVTSTGNSITKPPDIIGHIKQFSCSDCPASFDEWTAFTNHCYTHDNYINVNKSPSVSRGSFKPFKCLVCGVSFDAISQLTQHSFIHPSVVIGKAPYRCYVCEICGLSFNTISEQVSHKATHSMTSGNEPSSNTVVPFKCEKCPESFKSKFDLVSHQYIHFNQISPTYRNPTEPNNFASPNLIHYTPPAQNRFSSPAPNRFSQPTSSHYTSPAPNPCSPPTLSVYSPPTPNNFSSPAPNQCSPSTPNRFPSPAPSISSPPAPNRFSPSTTPNHFSSLAPNQPYSGPVTCPTCGVMYNKVCDLQEHVKIHANANSYQFYYCTVCKQGFKTEQELSHHQLVHTKTYYCQLCNVSYSSENELMYHNGRNHSS